MKLTKLRRALIFVRADHPMPAPRPPAGAIVGTGSRVVPTVYDELKTRRRRRLYLTALMIGLPTALSSVYYGLVASDRYISETRMVLSMPPGGGGPVADKGSSLMSLVGLAGGAGGAGNEQSIVADYLQSIEVMQAVDRKIGLRRMWSDPSVDYLSRLDAGAAMESFLRYFERHVFVIADPTQPVIQLQVEAFRPADAQLIGQTLVKLAQDKVNSAFLQMREDELGFGRSEVRQAEQRLAEINEKLRQFRNTHSEIDPTASAGAVSTVTGSLFAELSGAEADLRTMLSYAQQDSAIVKNQQARIAALRKQIGANRSLLAGKPTDGKPYSDLLGQYEDLLLDQKFAEAAYTSAMGFLETSRAGIMRQHAYLVDFIAPNLPEEATAPKRGRNVFLVMLASLLVSLTGTLIAAALREQAHG